MKTALTRRQFCFLNPQGKPVWVPKGTLVTWEPVVTDGTDCISVTFSGIEGEHQWEAEFEDLLHDNMGVLPVVRVPVLCGCGWGSLSMPENEVPECCPVCGNALGQHLN